MATTTFAPWIKRAPVNPIITPESEPGLGESLGGPALMRIPPFVDGLKGYALYFVAGTEVRMAISTSPEGPWQVRPEAAISLGDPVGVIESISAHADFERGEIRLYVTVADQAVDGLAFTLVAVSRDAQSFAIDPEPRHPAVRCVFRWRDAWYGVGADGHALRSNDGLGAFATGPRVLSGAVRHVAALVDGAALRLFFTEVGDCPERILHAAVELADDWQDWKPAKASSVVLEPDEGYEGGDLPLLPSRPGPADEPRRQLRHPAVYVEGEQRWLLYSVAGEQGIAIARFIP